MTLQSARWFILFYYSHQISRVQSYCLVVSEKNSLELFTLPLGPKNILASWRISSGRLLVIFPRQLVCVCLRSYSLCSTSHCVFFLPWAASTLQEYMIGYSLLDQDMRFRPFIVLRELVSKRKTKEFGNRYLRSCSSLKIIHVFFLVRIGGFKGGSA